MVVTNRQSLFLLRPRTVPARSGSDEEQAFVQNLALFLTAFFRAHAPALEVRRAARAGWGGEGGRRGCGGYACAAAQPCS